MFNLCQSIEYEGDRDPAGVPVKAGHPLHLPPAL